jgi:hypothetical protein
MFLAGGAGAIRIHTKRGSPEVTHCILLRTRHHVAIPPGKAIHARVACSETRTVHPIAATRCMIRRKRRFYGGSTTDLQGKDEDGLLSLVVEEILLYACVDAIYDPCQCVMNPRKTRDFW